MAKSSVAQKKSAKTHFWEMIYFQEGCWCHRFHCPKNSIMYGSGSKILLMTKLQFLIEFEGK